MTEKKEKSIVESLSYDWNKLELAEIAQEYLQEAASQGQEDSPLARKSLELLLKDIDASDPGILKTITDPKVVPLTIKNELDFYHEGLKTQTVGDRINYYQKEIVRYLGDDSGKVQEKLKPFLDTKYGDIKKKIVSAKHVLDGKKKGVEGISDEDVESAKKTMEKYSDVTNTLQILQERRRSELRLRVEDAYYKEVLKEIYLKPKEKSKK